MTILLAHKDKNAKDSTVTNTQVSVYSTRNNHHLVKSTSVLIIKTSEMSHISSRNVRPSKIVNHAKLVT